MPPNQPRFAKLFRDLPGKTTHELAPATDTRRLSQYWRDRTDLSSVPDVRRWR